MANVTRMNSTTSRQSNLGSLSFPRFRRIRPTFNSISDHQVTTVVHVCNCIFIDESTDIITADELTDIIFVDPSPDDLVTINCMLSML